LNSTQTTSDILTDLFQDCGTNVSAAIQEIIVRDINLILQIQIKCIL